MDGEVYRAALEGSIEKLKEPWNNEVTPMGNTVLDIHVARPIGKGKIKIKFIKHVLDLDSSLLRHVNENGETPLSLASRFGHVEVVREFIKRARAVNEEEVRKMVSTANKRRDTALHEAARGGHDQVVKLLVKANPGFPYEANEALETPLYLAAESGSHVSVALILPICTSPTDYRGPCARTALHAAVQREDLEMTQKIIEKYEALIRAPDDNGFTPFHHAAMRNNVQILSLCLDKETTNESAAYIRDKEGRTPLHIAAYFGHLTSFKKIISYHPDCVEIVDKKEQNAIHYAASMLCIHKFKHFLDLGNDLGKFMHEIDMDGNTPLHLYAAWKPYARCWCILPCVHSYFMKGLTQCATLFNKKNLTPLEIGRSVDQSETLSTGEVLHDKAHVTGARTLRIGKVEDMREISKEKLKKVIESVKESSQSHLVAAALVATVSFAAALTLPGGFNQNPGPGIGMAVMSKKIGFELFLEFNSLAFACSSLAVFLYFLLSILVTRDHIGKILNLSVIMAFADILCTGSILTMIPAFFAGLQVTLRMKNYIPPLVSCFLAVYYIGYICVIHRAQIYAALRAFHVRAIAAIAAIRRRTRQLEF